MAAAESTVGTARRKHSMSRWNWFGADTLRSRSERCGAATCFESGERWRRSPKNCEKNGAEREMRNHQQRRREFLNLTGAGIAALAGGAWPGTAMAAEGPDADLVVFNAKVYTVDSRAPRVEAFAVKAGRFTALGTTAEMKALTGKGTQTFDAKQMTIVPGFIDCHNHAPGEVLLYEVLVGNP